MVIKIFNVRYKKESGDFSSAPPHKRSWCWLRSSLAKLRDRRGRELSGVNSSHAGCKKRGVLAVAVMGLATDDQVRMIIPSEPTATRGNSLLPVSHETLGLQLGLG